MDPKTPKILKVWNQKIGQNRSKKYLLNQKVLTFEPLNGFSNFKSLNDLEFCQESFKLTAEVVLAKTKEIGLMKN